MQITETKISPVQAREWLAVQPDRAIRPIRRRTVEQLIHAIDTGEWKLTHQPIAIASDGFVLDGRHRLTAIGAQRKHVRALVAFDADPDTYTVIDTGTRRTPSDTLRISGFTDTHVLAATARQVAAYPEIIGTADTLSTITNKMTTTTVLSTVDDPEIGKIIVDALRPASRISSGISKHGYRTSASVLCAVIRIYSDAGPDTQNEFVERLADGVQLASDSPILGLRKWILSDTGLYRYPGTWRPTAALVSGIKAWNDYVNARPRQSFVYRPGITPMPEVE